MFGNPRYTSGLKPVLEKDWKCFYGNWNSNKITVWKMFDTWLSQSYGIISGDTSVLQIKSSFNLNSSKVSLWKFHYKKFVYETETVTVWVLKKCRSK